MTQDQLGKHWGKSGNYIYMLEAGIKPFPKKLEIKLHELEDEVSKKLYSLRAAPDRLQDALSPATLPGTRAPVVSWASAGRGGAYSDLAEFLDEFVETDCRDANKYALIVEGDSMRPEFQPGDRIVVTPNSEPQNGDEVVARLREGGEVFFKIFHETSTGKILLTSYNPAFPPLEFQKTDFRFIQPVYEMVRKRKIPKPRK